jgi:ABC-type glutathione transport system ATPase component
LVWVNTLKMINSGAAFDICYTIEENTWKEKKSIQLNIKGIRPALPNQGTMILRAENLVKKYKQRTVVNNVSFHVSQGEIVGLLGPNGAGKTTSFYMIVGLIRPNEGHVFLDDQRYH